MALSASLSLDVRAFEAGAKKAVVEMQGIERAGKTVNRDLKRLMEDFSGQKIAVEAARVAEAVSRIGGASVLTATEQRRVNATVTEAIAKYQALGQTAPANLIALQQATAKASTSTSTLLGAVGQMAAAFSVASLINRGASALSGFASAAIASAGELVDLRASTGASLTALQQWSQVASQGGIELSNMTTAAFKLGVAIDGGNSSVRNAVQNLGLSFEALRAMKPEDQMDAILRAADKVGSSQERNADLVDLFGAKGAQSLARVVDGYAGVADAATLASDAQIEALDRAGDAWDRFTKGATTNTVSMLGTIVMWAEDSLAAVELTTEGMKRFSDGQRATISGIINSGGEGLAAYLRDVSSARTTDIELSAASGRAHRKSAEDIAAESKALRDAAAELKQFTDAVNTLSGAKALDDTAKAMEHLQAAGGTLKVLPSQLEALAKQFTAGAEAARMLGDVELAEFYAAVAEELKPLNQLQARATVVIGQYASQAEDMTQAVMDQNDALRDAGAIYIGIIPNVGKLAQAWVPFKAAVESSLPGIRTANAELKKLADQAARREAAASLRDLASALADLSQIGGGSDLGKIAEVLGAMSVGAEAGNQMREALDKIGQGGKTAAAGLIQMAAGAVAAASALAKVTGEGSRASRVMGGIATGASAGSAFGPWGAIIGGVIGGVVGAVRSLDQATESNASQMVDWAKVIADATDKTGRLRSDVVALIVKMRELGTTTQAVRDYMQAQASSALTAFNAVAAGTVRWSQYGDAVKAAQKKIDDLKQSEAGGGASDPAKMKAAQDELTNALREQHRVSGGAKQSLADLAVQALSAFNAALASGMSYSAALKLIQPGVQALIKAHQDLGLSMDDPAMAALAMQSALLEKNPQILAGLDGLAQGMLALSNLGLMNQDTFAAMQRTAMEMFTRLQGEVAAMGGSQRDALLPMQAYLQEAAAQAKALGIPLDANTQMLIDQSKELGIWKDKAIGPTEELRDAMRELRDTIKELADAFRKVPSRVDTQVNTRYTREGEPPDGAQPPSDGTGGSGGTGGSSGWSRNGGQGYGVERGAAAIATDYMPQPIEVNITVKTDIDGRQVAEVVVPYIPDALRRRGVTVATWP